MADEGSEGEGGTTALIAVESRLVRHHGPGSTRPPYSVRGSLELTHRAGLRHELTSDGNLKGAGGAGCQSRCVSDTRVGPGYATFSVAGAGDTGQVTIEVITPATMTFDSTWDGFTSSDDGDRRIHRSTESQDGYGTVAYVSVRDPAQADTSEVTIGETTVTLSSFPGDTEWTDFVTEQVTAGLPLLEETIGQPWPGSVDTIREDVSPQILGYAWFDPGRGEIVVPEDLDAALLMHELSHAWLNASTFEGRWLYEGLAELVSQHVSAQIVGDQPTREEPDRTSSDAVALTAWDEVDITDGADEGDDYGYAASYTALAALTDDLDDDALAEVVSAAYAGQSAYQGPDEDIENRRTDWRRFLDLIEMHTDGSDAEEVYRTWVLGDDEQDLLEARAPARESYAAIDAADGAWVPPLGLRTAMTEWTFEEATTISTALGAAGTSLTTDAVASAAGAVQSAADAAGVPVPDSVRERYEQADSAEDYSTLAQLLPQAVDVVENVGDAVQVAADDSNPLGEIGQLLLSVDASAADARDALADGDLDGADLAASTTIDRAEAAPWLGAGVLVLVLVGIAGAVLLIVRARRRPATATSAAADGGAQAGFEPNGGAWSAPGAGVGYGSPHSHATSLAPPPGAGHVGEPTTAPPALQWPPPAATPPPGPAASPGVGPPPEGPREDRS